jgi:hypothetical protein
MKEFLAIKIIQEEIREERKQVGNEEQKDERKQMGKEELKEERKG